MKAEAALASRFGVILALSSSHSASGVVIVRFRAPRSHLTRSFEGLKVLATWVSRSLERSPRRS